MPKYIFLDTWLLDDYTKADKVDTLAVFIARNQYTVVISSLLLTELYNEKWEGEGEKERGWRIVNFLSGQQYVIAHPEAIWQQEFQSYPNHVKRLPIEPDLDHIPTIPRAQALLRFLRRDQIFLDMGKDIATWATGYKDAKTSWLADAAAVIEDGITSGELIRDGKGHVTARDDALKQQYLFRLDMRLCEGISYDGSHISDDVLQPYIEGVFRDKILLRAVRLTSLAFWYQYVGFDPTFRPKQGGSDLGDILYTSFIPWCATYTTDSKFIAAVRQAAVEAKCTSCKILSRDDIDRELRNAHRR